MTRSTSLRLVLLAALVAAAGCSPGADPVPDPCAPQCSGRTCGDDQCGGSCGTCQDGLICDVESGTCGECRRNCDGFQCGDDGCGGTCGDCPGNGSICNPYTRQCVGGCNGSCEGQDCGSDGCTGSCGECSSTKDCFQGMCVPKASCTDGKKNGTEGDTDCGGSCPDKCAVGATCGGGGDCTSGDCTDGTCRADVTCSNTEPDPGETDVDCGGPKCPRCALGKYCQGHPDCMTLACVFGVCTEPTCKDGAKNQGESDIDCGGPCGQCPDGRTCFDKGDCQEGGCDEGICCTANACGECSASPDEICDGKDNDCDGDTDEADQVGAGDPCPRQDGVCQGARNACRNGAWTCDAQAYSAWNAAYQSTESSCDGKDNDCNGQTDEPPKCCVPKCSAKECGDDGCGSTCGTCDSDRYCWVSLCYSKGAVRWSHTVTGYTVTSTPVVNAAGEVFYTTDFPFELVVLDAGGNQKKAITAPTDVSYWNLALAPGDLVLAQRSSGGVAAFDGKLASKWTNPIPIDRLGIGAGGTFYGTSVDDAGQFSLAAFTSTQTSWTTPLGDATADYFFNGQPAIAADGSLYVGGDGRVLYKLDAAGKVLWTRTLDGRLDDSSPAIGPDGTVYIGTHPGQYEYGKSLYAFTPAGTQKWTFEADSEGANWPIVGPDGTIHFIDQTQLYAITPAGQQKWKVPLLDRTYNSAAVTRDGIVVVPTYSGIQAFDPAGNLLWEFAKNVDSAAVLTDDGLVLFNENTGSGSKVWALEVTSTPGSSWPMEGHDSRRSYRQTDATGAAPY